MAFRLTLSLLTIALIGCVSAYPRVSRAVASKPKVNPAAEIETTSPSSKDASAQIIQYANQFNPEDNSFVFQYETDNGIKVQGTAKDNKVNVQGSYFLVMPDGNQVPVSYIADESGFRVESPALPTPHPIIAKMAEYLRTLPPQKEPEEDTKSAAGSKGVDI